MDSPIEDVPPRQTRLFHLFVQLFLLQVKATLSALRKDYWSAQNALSLKSCQDSFNYNLQRSPSPHAPHSTCNIQMRFQRGGSEARDFEIESRSRLNIENASHPERYNRPRWYSTAWLNSQMPCSAALRERLRLKLRFGFKSLLWFQWFLIDSQANELWMTSGVLEAKARKS